MKKKNTHLLHKALHAAHFGAIAGLVYVLVVAVVLVYVGSAAWVRPAKASNYSVFNGSRAWTMKLPTYPTLANDSAAIAASIAAQASSYGAVYDTTDRGASVFVVDDSMPTVAVLPWDCASVGSTDPALAAMWTDVPMPIYAQPASGVGKNMIIYDTSSQTIWEFGNARKTGPSWEACTGGKLSAAGAGVHTAGFGLNDTSLAHIGGQVSAKEWQSGFIGHAIGLGLPAIGGPGSSWPAVQTIGTPQGMRLQLDPSLDIDSLGLTRAGKAVAKAAQTYGFIVWDVTPQVSIAGESPVSETARGLADPYGGSPAADLANFPWDKLRALPPSYGQTDRTPAITSFTSSATSVAAGMQVQFAWQAIEVSECAIPGIVEHGGATGTATSADIVAGSSFTLSCSGPWGSVSKVIEISATNTPTNAPPPQNEPVVLTEQLSGDAIVLKELASKEAAETVQKVLYYEHGRWLATNTLPPFSLNTRTLADGKHVLSLQVYYRDGRRVAKTADVQVKNLTEKLVIPQPLSAEVADTPFGPAVKLFGLVGAFGVMGVASWFGWRKTGY